MSKDRTFYQILGVSENAKPEEIRSTYLGKARKLHPDNFQNASKREQMESEMRMRELNEAWSTLSSEEKRSNYDLKLQNSNLKGKNFEPNRSATYQEWTPEVREEKQPTRYATEEEMKLTWFAKLVRPVPLLLILIGGVVAVAIVASLGIGSNDDSTRPVPMPTGTPEDCMEFGAGSRGIKVPCDGEHDAIIWTTVFTGESCPEGLKEIYNAQGEGGRFCYTLAAQG